MVASVRAMRRIGVVVAGVLGVLVLVASLVGLVRAQAGGTVRAEVVDGIPVTVYSTNQAAPTVVIAHGFAGSAQIMDPLARGLMRSGFTVVTFDFDGHGRNAAALGIDPAREGSSGDALQASLATVISWAATQPTLSRVEAVTMSSTCWMRSAYMCVASLTSKIFRSRLRVS